MPYLRTFMGRLTDRDSGSILLNNEGRRIEASTLEEALRVAEQIIQARIVPHDPPKFFRIYRLPEQPESYQLVDIHLVRNGEDICLKQGLAFPLLDSDVVVMGTLVC